MAEARASSGSLSSSGAGVAVTPHATNPITAGPAVSRMLWVGTAGDLVVRLVEDSADITIPSVPAGTQLLIRASHVRASSTAGGIVAFF